MLIAKDYPVSSNVKSAPETALESLQFAHSSSTRVDFQVGDTELQLQVEACAPGVFRLRCARPAQLNPEKLSPRAEAHTEMLLARPEPVGELAVSSLIEQRGGAWQIEQGDVRLDVGFAPLQITLHKGDQKLLSSVPKATLAANVSSDAPLWQLNWQLSDTEGLFGLGETTGNLNRRGERLDTDSAPWRTLPLVWSTNGWGLYVNTLKRVEHDLGSSQPNVYSVCSHTAILDVYLFTGEPGDILNQYTAQTGRAGQPELWPMGVWLDQVEAAPAQHMLSLARHLREQGLAFDVIRLANPAVYGFQHDKPNFEWDPERFANPRELFAQFDELKLKVAAPSFPGVIAGTYQFEEWEDRGWLLIDDDTGEAYQFEGNAASGGKPFGLLDLTHRDGYRLFVERQRQMVDEGLGAPICDARFNIPDNITARRGESGTVLRNIYPILARQALFDAVAGHKTPQEGIMLSTDLFPGVQRFAWQLGPKVSNDWDGMALSLRTALALGNSGVTVQTHTLGNPDAPTDKLTPELYIRWLALNVLSANFSFQATEALLPDAFDEETQKLVTHWLEWRYRLIPYVLGIIEDAVRSGMPVQRSMALGFPEDKTAQEWDTQYMFGPALLVAPVLKPGVDHEIYLPEGSAWWDVATGWRYEGGQVLSVKAELNTLPIFGREGQILCLGPAAQNTTEFNSARLLEEVWMFGMPEQSPVVMRNKIRVMQMQGSSYIKGLEGLKILPSEGLEVKRRGAEVRISRMR